jgi:hypothetical protein
LRNPSNKEKPMVLRFAGMDPGTNGDHCPAVFVDEETGDFVFQGWTVTDPVTLADVARRSPIADSESVVRLPCADAADPLGGAQWPSCHRSAS